MAAERGRDQASSFPGVAGDGVCASVGLLAGDEQQGFRAEPERFLFQ